MGKRPAGGGVRVPPSKKIKRPQESHVFPTASIGKMAPTAITPPNDILGALEEARGYRLGTVRIPLDSFTREWSIGTNRVPTPTHIVRLRRIFEELGVQRAPGANHVMVACTAGVWKKVVDTHLPRRRLEIQRQLPNATSQIVEATAVSHFERQDLPNALQWPLIDDWEDLSGGRAELMAGQHRIAAMKQYLEFYKKENPQTSEVRTPNRLYWCPGLS